MSLEHAADSEDPKETKRRLEDILKDSIESGFAIPLRPRGFSSKDEAGGKSNAQADESFELNFDYKPRDVKKYLDRFVIGQHEAKRVLSIAICDHYSHVHLVQKGEGLKNYLKPNILLLGPTGVGKTYLIRCLAELVGVPFVKADATKFSETGYVGQDVDDLVRQLVQQSNGNLNKAQCGIIYLDEVDKLASSGSFSGRDVSGRGVQTNLLKLMEETEVSLRAANDMQAQMEAAFEAMQGGRSKPKTINTRNILFIASGSFPKLQDIIDRRKRAGSIGFQAKNDELDKDTNTFDDLMTEDLIEYGFEAEFAGRMPVRVACLPLTVDNLACILNQSEGSILLQYKSVFATYGIKLEFKSEAVRLIAEKAVHEQTGARALLSVLEKILRGTKYELPSTRLKSLIVDEAFVNAPDQALKKLLEEARNIEAEEYESLLEEFAKFFYHKHQLRLKFTKEASVELIKLAHEDQEHTFLEFCEERFKDFPYGLKLIVRHNPHQEFVVDKGVALNPEKALSEWVVQSYHREENEKNESQNP
ncbi:MAG: AAA family ATPase [Verrucomicrobiota bacterium]